MGSSNTQDELESRFANLLQPIRDLTKNWDVDIASSLEDYLEEVGNLHFRFVNCQFGFAQISFVNMINVII